MYTYVYIYICICTLTLNHLYTHKYPKPAPQNPGRRRLSGDLVPPDPQDVAQGQGPSLDGRAQTFLQLAEHGALQGVFLTGAHLAELSE